jgi:aldose 1-epimerase
MAFDISINDSGSSPVITLRQTDTGSSAEVYAFGALLNKFEIGTSEGPVNVIEGYASLQDAHDNITPAFKSAKLSPFVCRIKKSKYHFGEAVHKLTKYVVSESALHGLVFDQVFSVIETTAGDEFAKVVLQYVYNNPNEGFPFTYRCQVEYCLKKDNTLCLTTVVTNIDDQLLPVADGWHPYFTFGGPIDECQLEFQSLEMLEFSPDLLPTGKLIPYQEYGSIRDIGSQWFDNCFTANMQECQPLAVFRHPKKKLQVEIHPGKNYTYLQIFTPPHRQSIAIENLSAAPDALNNAMGLHVLEPQESITFSTKYIIKKLD